MSRREEIGGALLPSLVLPDDLACRLSVSKTPVNPYEIRLCDWPRRAVAAAARRNRAVEARFTAFALELPSSGRKSLTPTEGPGVVLTAGVLAAISPGFYRLEESADYSARLLFFNERFPSDFLAQNFASVPAPSGAPAIGCALGEAGARGVSDAMDAVLAEAKVVPCMARMTLQQIFLRMIARSSDAVRGFLATAAFRDHGGLPAFIAAHAADGLSNRELARQSGRSLSAFHRQFQSAFGATPQRWLMEQRLARAKTLLESTSMRITDIAYETGFRDPAHFSRAFKQRFGKTPRAFRAGRHRPVRSQGK